MAINLLLYIYNKVILSSVSTYSFKFGRKINYVSYLSELQDVVKCEQLLIPAPVKE